MTLLWQSLNKYGITLHNALSVELKSGREVRPPSRALLEMAVEIRDHFLARQISRYCVSLDCVSLAFPESGLIKLISIFNIAHVIRDIPPCQV